MRRFINAPNALTIAGLVSSWAAVLAAANAMRTWAFGLLAFAGICDLLDGPAARRRRSNDEERRFGGHLDSLVDACAFGFAPAIVLYLCGHTRPPEVAVCGALVIAAVWRLAYFETAGLRSEASGLYYTGLPVTFSSLCLPFAALLFRRWLTVDRWALDLIAAALAFLMVSPISIPKPLRLKRVLLVCGILLATAYAAGS
jgi:CDP-diacylglycerol--serine O-phosphatidyltransferase